MRGVLCCRIMRCNRAKLAVVLLPALLALALRIYGLADKPLWLDEVLTQKRSLLPFSQMVADSLVNKHLPTYFIIVRPFDAPIVNEALLRLPSAIFGSLAVLLAALIASEARTPRAGLVAGMLMALSPIEVEFGQEARSYALVSCLVMLALWGLVRIVKQSAGDAPAGSAKSGFAGWAAYVIGTVGALNVLLVSAFWLLCANLAWPVALQRAGANRGGLLRSWMLLQGLVVLAWLPGLIAIARINHGNPLRGTRWIPPSTVQHVGSVLTSVYLFRATNVSSFALVPTLLPGFGFIVLALALYGAWRLKADVKLLAVIGFAAIAMPVAMLVLSIFHAVWVPRYLLWGTGAYYVMAGIGVAALPRRLFIPVAGALAVGGLVNLAPYYHAETKPRWDLAAAYLATHVRPDDSIVVNDGPAKTMLDAYGARTGLDRPAIDGYYIDHATAHLRPGGDVWIVFGRTGQGKTRTPESYLRKWSALGTPAATVRFGGEVVAWRFERDGAARAPSR
jgi:mannosyltransferase